MNFLTWLSSFQSLSLCLDCCFYLQTLHLFLCLVKSESLPRLVWNCLAGRICRASITEARRMAWSSCWCCVSFSCRLCREASWNTPSLCTVCLSLCVSVCLFEIHVVKPNSHQSTHSGGRTCCAVPMQHNHQRKFSFSLGLCFPSDFCQSACTLNLCTELWQESAKLYCINCANFKNGCLAQQVILFYQGFWLRSIARDQPGCNI